MPLDFFRFVIPSGARDLGFLPVPAHTQIPRCARNDRRKVQRASSQRNQNEFACMMTTARIQSRNGGLSATRVPVRLRRPDVSY